jgi:hypothetical protein
MEDNMVKVIMSQAQENNHEEEFGLTENELNGFDSSILIQK